MNNQLRADTTQANSVIGATTSEDTTWLALADLEQPDSPRLSGVDEEHARLLADSDGVLTPVLVNRRTMRIVDGAHRLLAARMRDQQEIEVRFCDCDDHAAFVLAVESNVTHGLPLSRADRNAAAQRIIASYPEWSDRVIASVAGLSHKTVGAIRARATGNAPQSDTRRRGRDGRLRPVDGSAGRAEVIRLLTDRKDASLREIAREAGVSPDTVRNVRDRLRRGEDPVVPAPRGAQPADVGRAATRPKSCVSVQVPGFPEKSALIRSLRNDPSLRFSDAGRVLLRLLDTYVLESQDWARLSENVPAHRAENIAQLARECGRAWQKFAVAVEQRQRDFTAV